MLCTILYFTILYSYYTRTALTAGLSSNTIKWNQRVEKGGHILGDFRGVGIEIRRFDTYAFDMYLLYGLYVLYAQLSLMAGLIGGGADQISTSFAIRGREEGEEKGICLPFLRGRPLHLLLLLHVELLLPSMIPHHTLRCGDSFQLYATPASRDGTGWWGAYGVDRLSSV